MREANQEELAKADQKQTETKGRSLERHKSRKEMSRRPPRGGLNKPTNIPLRRPGRPLLPSASLLERP